MVKKILDNFLKRKSGVPKDTPSQDDDIPDELPALAEDVTQVDNSSNAPVESKAEIRNEANSELPPLDSGSNEEVPDELPSIDDSQDSSTDNQPEPSSIENASSSKPQVQPQQPQAQQPAQPQPQPQQSAQQPAQSTQSPAPNTNSSDNSSVLEIPVEKGFFSSLMNHVKDDKEFRERLLDGNLFSRMNNYWDLRKTEIKEGKAVSTEKKLEDDLFKKVQDLSELEKKWHIQKMALEEDLKFLNEREAEIRIKAEELKILSEKLKLFKNVAPKYYFHLNNGIVIRNLSEMIEALEIIDDQTFNHHVNSTNNDFGNWIKTTTKDMELASKIANSRSKQDMISILENESFSRHKPKKEESAPTEGKEKSKEKEYFWLSNGAVIKNLRDLSDALRFLDDGTFSSHVNGNKNDFSDWVKHSLKEESLASKLKDAKTRQDMIKLLEPLL